MPEQCPHRRVVRRAAIGMTVMVLLMAWVCIQADHEPSVIERLQKEMAVNERHPAEQRDGVVTTSNPPMRPLRARLSDLEEESRRLKEELQGR